MKALQVYLMEEALSLLLLLRLIQSRTHPLREGPDWELALHGQAWQLLKPLCFLLHEFQTKFNPQFWHLQLGQSLLLLELHRTSTVHI